MKQYLLLLACLLWFTQAGKGQISQLGLDIHAGKLLLHSKSLTIPSPKVSTAVSGQFMTHRTRTNGKQISFGWQLYHVRLGNEKILGNITGLFPMMELPLSRPRTKFTGVFSLGSGIAYATKKNDIVINPSNNAISNSWNNVTQLGFRLGYPIQNSLALSFRGVLTHFSNGAYSLPNLGINVGSLALGLRYDFKNTAATPLQIHTLKRKIQWQVISGFAFTESGPSGGFSSPYYMVGLGAGLARNQGIWWLQTRYDLQVSRMRFLQYIGSIESKTAARKQSEQVSLTVGREWLLGQFGLVGHLGSYVHDPTGAIPIFEIIGVHWYGTAKDNALLPFVGLEMKAHLTVASYLMLVAGLRI